MTSPANEYDVVIVGAGVAGCYTAYRLLNGDLDPNSPLGILKQQNGKLNVALFEYSGRAGGRLLSAQLPEEGTPAVPIGSGSDAPRQFAEFGGFRFQPQMHIVSNLADYLDLTYENFPVDEPPQNPIYVRSKRLTRKQVDEGQNLPYNLTPLELDIAQGKYASQGNPDLSTYVLNQVFVNSLPNGPGATPELPNGYDTIRGQYQAAFTAGNWVEAARYRVEFEAAKQQTSVDNRSISYWSYWSTMTRFLSQEAIDFLEDTGGYNSLASSGNIPANIQDDFYFFGEPANYDPSCPCENTAWKHIKTGYSDIPNQLYYGFVDAGGAAFFNYQLLGFDKNGQGNYQLGFYNRGAGDGTTTAQGEGNCQITPAKCCTVKATYVVLAMPKLALDLLDQNNFFFRDQQVLNLLNTVDSVEAIRIFMAYPKPWWTDYDLKCGRSTTDLNVRQFYYWYTADPGDSNQDSFLLASYSNGDAEAYWLGLESGGNNFDDYNGSVPESGRFDAPQGKGPRHCTEVMAELAHQQIVQTVGANIKDVPQPYYAHFQDWGKVTWGAGWHVWSSGAQFNNTLIPEIIQPLPTESIYICGEGYSNVQGWVQGALNTAEVMLQKKLGLEWPTWLSKGGTWLGPGSEGLG